MSEAESKTSRDCEGAEGGVGDGDQSRSLTVAARSEDVSSSKLTMMERGRAYLEVARLSNAPTVISNVLTGVAIGLANSPDAAPSWITLAYLGFGVLLLYIGGMALNDWVDAPFDRKHNRNRPIPSGRMSRIAALLFALFSFAEGMALIGMASRVALIPAGILVALIIAYDLMHKKHAATVLLMGLCRGMVYIVATVAVAGAFDWATAAPFAAGLALFVTLLTVIARGEHRPGSARSSWSGALLAAITVAPVLLIDVAQPMWVMSAGALLAVWVVLAGLPLGHEPPRVKATVLRWLAGICLVDVLYLAALDAPLFASIALVCFLLTVLAHRRIPGT